MSKIPDPNKMKRINDPDFSKQSLESTKVRITTFLDTDVLEQLKKEAAETGGKYQTTLNQILRDHFSGTTTNVLDRIKKLENAVFKKKRA